ncbi:MAG: hypothetical protein JW852_01565 [Spirochaetales bacterium]|nr:hypothetical protein [Spirochaetales bacterium]
MKKIAYALVAVLLIVFVMSCTTFKLSGIQVTKEIQSYQRVGEFKIEVPVMELLGASGGANIGNFTATAMDEKIYDAIQREISKYTGDAAVNVTVEYRFTLINAVLNSLTGSILAPAVAEVSGVIVKYSN